MIPLDVLRQVGRVRAGNEFAAPLNLASRQSRAIDVQQISLLEEVPTWSGGLLPELLLLKLLLPDNLNLLLIVVIVVFLICIAGIFVTVTIRGAGSGSRCTATGTRCACFLGNVEISGLLLSLLFLRESKSTVQKLKHSDRVNFRI